MPAKDIAATRDGDAAAMPPRVRKAKITPLPLSQMIPMTFVIVNESLCATMLMPFIGPLVAFLRGVSVNEAGYFSGMMIGMFMLGQVVSAKAWGRISDKYGRRFPIISGLFTSGLMMLGFGLSTNVWVLAVFRFLHGLCNGNILVAKTMMADITDRTNQGGGFSFMSICNAFGFLIGPGLGGLLYDPANSEGLAWAHFSKTGFFATHPAFLTSLVVFIYTNIGMLVCTFLVKESNPNAQPLPGFVRYVYPCLWYKSEPFVLPPIQYEDESDDDTNGLVKPNTKLAGEQSKKKTREEDEASTLSSNNDSRKGVVALPFSPVDHEDSRQFDQAVLEELVIVSLDTPFEPQYPLPQRPSPQQPQHGSTRRSRRNSTTSHKSVHGENDDGESDHGREGAARHVRASTTRAAAEHRETKEAEALSTRDGAASDTSDSVPVPPAEEVVTKFGYREAFARPYTRFMLSQYMVLCATDMAARECFPLWAVATADAGGLGMTISQVSYILLLNSLPCFVGNYFFRIFERRYTNKMGLFRLGMFVGGTAVLLLPFNSYVHWKWVMYTLVYICTATRQVFVSWCYSLNTMLTARSAPPGHVGSIMGINQSCNAIVRSIIPFLAAPIFAWSISGDHIFPFNHVLIFFVSAAVFYSGWWRSYSIRTDMDGNLQMVQ